MAKILWILVTFPNPPARFESDALTAVTHGWWKYKVVERVLTGQRETPW